ncbi:type II toxin-antitoxin system VapC family toxin [Acidocella facilis]|uniref:type II toxin-antitoxin system VapC family toxin n=1 Tax=Acidocella facilis TaxID=525 RepID=UPI001F2017DB|nr:type II toxin-antitoxin system VapC family toxin [Acidocella facilis]
MTLAFYLLDTDTASFIIKGRSPAIEAKLIEIPPDRLCISAITRAELMYGLKRLPAGHRLHAGVRQFFNIVPVLAWDSDAADHYADIRHQLTTTGQPIGDPDMMIAAHALAIGAVLVTNNTRHFERISVSSPLVLENWFQ